MKKIPTYCPCIWNFTNTCRSRIRHVYETFNLGQELGSWPELHGFLSVPFSEVCSSDQEFYSQSAAHTCLSPSPLGKCLSRGCVLEMGFLSLAPWASCSLYGSIFLPFMNPPWSLLTPWSSHNILDNPHDWFPLLFQPQQYNISCTLPLTNSTLSVLLFLQSTFSVIKG